MPWESVLLLELSDTSGHSTLVSYRSCEASVVMRVFRKRGKEHEIPIRTTLRAWMTVDRAAGHLLDCLETRPIQPSRPSVAAACVLCARWLQTVRVWWS